jgi:hypothetical protein
MMGQKIIFYNHYHNGDLHYTKPLVRDLMSQLPNSEFSYAHLNGYWVVRDLNIPQGPFNTSAISDHATILYGPDAVLVNTWLGTYLKVFNQAEVTWNFYYKFYCEIIRLLNNMFHLNLMPKPQDEFWLPTTDYSYYAIDNAKEFDRIEKRKKILISNGPGMSKQIPEFNSDMSEMIRFIAEKHQDKMFIVTKRFEHKQNNIISTTEINKLNRTDLNEIGYISTFCDVIIGRDSGPFCFTHTRENLMNPNKTFMSFSKDPDITCFFYGSYDKLKCKFIGHKFTGVQDLQDKIESLIA